MLLRPRNAGVFHDLSQPDDLGAHEALQIVDKLHDEVKAVLALPESKAEFARTARITVDSPPVDELQRFMRSEIVRLGKVVEQAGIARSQ